MCLFYQHYLIQFEVFWLHVCVSCIIIIIIVCVCCWLCYNLPFMVLVCFLLLLLRKKKDRTQYIKIKSFILFCMHACWRPNEIVPLMIMFVWIKWSSKKIPFHASISLCLFKVSDGGRISRVFQLFLITSPKTFRLGIFFQIPQLNFPWKVYGKFPQVYWKFSAPMLPYFQACLFASDPLTEMLHRHVFFFSPRHSQSTFYRENLFKEHFLPD